MLKLELVLSVTAVAAAFAFPNFGARWFDRMAGIFRPLAQRQTLSVVCVGILAVVARLAVLPVLPIPAPAIHDEFSYLLMADTFAHGRLANPTPPMWEHFETFHENMVPTYVSKYFPAQGAFLAVGQVVLGKPFWGVVLSTALMCAAICWMLQAWVSPGWALLGGILAVIRLAMFSYWNNSYWGGSVAALGGALALGALPRIRRTNRLSCALALGTGVALLASSRPYESVFVVVPCAVALLIWMTSQVAPPTPQIVRKLLLPNLIVLGATFGWLMYYNWRTTGDPMQTPYSVNEKTYSASPVFPWQKRPATPVYVHDVMRRFYADWVVSVYKFHRGQPLTDSIVRGIMLLAFYFGPSITLFALAGLGLIIFRSDSGTTRGSDIGFLSLVISLVLLGTCLPSYFMPHYIAPVTAAIYALVVTALKSISEIDISHRSVGVATVGATILVCVILVPVRILASRSKHLITAPAFKTWASASDSIPGRAKVITQLDNFTERDMVIVRYTADHDPHSEWVFNGADIEHEKIIWARDMGPKKNRELIDYFKDRKVWLVEPDLSPVRITPYTDKTPANSSTPPNL